LLKQDAGSTFPKGQGGEPVITGGKKIIKENKIKFVIHSL
jgi:hypothetical protein